ncbi:MAG: hypothetical protein K9K67_14145 [Bacteriovoracaceae bacterium]|nr:hypothetical protein [Bacteriovoracaceae bacterium]
MDKIYSRFTLESFKKAAIAALLFGDIALFTYIYLKFSNKEAYHQSLKVVLKAMPEMEGQLPADFAQQLYSLMVNSLITMLALAMIYHIFVYYLWSKKNKGLSRGYIAVYAWTAGPLCSLSGLISLPKNTLNGLLFLAIGLSYLFVALGLSQFPEPKSTREKSVK